LSRTKSDYTQDTAIRHDISIEILSDVGNQVRQQLGLVFSLAEELRPIHLGAGLDIPARNGEDTFKLPLPTTYIVGPGGIIESAFTDADYTRRMEAADILAILRGQ
jgi:peroxiredoxin